MKEYERLTIKAFQNYEDRFYKDSIYTRLQELEDKIENGTLIDMPRIIHPNKAEWYVQYQYPSGVIQYYICFSEAEAEAKLKELKGE